MGLMIDYYVYVDPNTRRVAGMYLFGGLGALTRQDGDWIPADRETDPNMMDFAKNYITYEIDFNKFPDVASGKETSTTAEEELDDDPLVKAFDNGTITEDMVAQYGTLIQDENGNNPESPIINE